MPKNRDTQSTPVTEAQLKALARALVKNPPADQGREATLDYIARHLFGLDWNTTKATRLTAPAPLPVLDLCGLVRMMSQGGPLDKEPFLCNLAEAALRALIRGRLIFDSHHGQDSVATAVLEWAIHSLSRPEVTKHRRALEALNTLEAIAASRKLADIERNSPPDYLHKIECALRAGLAKKRQEPDFGLLVFSVLTDLDARHP